MIRSLNTSNYWCFQMVDLFSDYTYLPGVDPLHQYACSLNAWLQRRVSQYYGQGGVCSKDWSARVVEDVWCLFRRGSTCNIPLEQKRHPLVSALVFQDVGHVIGWRSLQCTWALYVSAAKNSHHHSWQLSKIPHIHFCLPMFWSLCSNMKVSLTLTSSTLVLRQNLPG